MSYYSISSFGSSAGMSPQTDPVSYCAVSGLESGFLHTLGSGSGLLGPDSSQCQLFMGQRCSYNWDGVCEYVSNDNSRMFPNTVNQCNGPNGSCMGPGIGNALTKGQILIRNTAAEKYLSYMSGNCIRDYEPFDPTVADSPLISKWIPAGNACGSNQNCYASNKCIPIYDVDPKTIDSDPVMNKILMQPTIAMDILVNIYNNRVNRGTLNELSNTKLYQLFMNLGFQQIVRSKFFTQS